MKIFLLMLVNMIMSANGFGVKAAAATTAVVLKDHSAAATGLFNNMRTPAALIGGAIIPLGILSAPKIEENDTKLIKIIKKANLLLAIASLLSEITAITYSTVAINKIAEITYPPTAGVAEYISTYHDLPWIGTNIHFLFGLFGFGLLAIGKPYFAFGKSTGNVAACWASAAMLFCVSIVNRGISMGHGSVEDTQARVASNIFGLTMKYIQLVMQRTWGRPLRMLTIAIMLYSLIPLKKMMVDGCQEKIN